MGTFLASLSQFLSVPGLVLLFLLAIGLHVIFTSQKRDDFDWADMLKDESGKFSAFRLGVLVCLVGSTWVLLYITMYTVKDPAGLETLFKYYGAYLVVWSGAKVVEKGLEVFIALKLPKPAAPQANPPAGS